MALKLGRGTTIWASSVGGNYLIWDVNNWDEANWAPGGGAGRALIVIAGLGSLVLHAYSYVTVQNDLLTFGETAVVAITRSVNTVSFAGQVLADFIANIEGSTAEFADTSYSDGSGGDIVTWAWEFGDGGTSSEQNPTYEYSVVTGSYTVSLTVTNALGNQSTANLRINLNPLSFYLVWDEGNWDQRHWL